MSSSSSSPVIGVVVLTRHGDRQGFYQNPKTYKSSQTKLTILGYQQQLYNGQDLRSLYVSSGSPRQIQGIDPDLFQDQQVSVSADANGEGQVIVESANAFMQGLYPPTNENLTLANGTTVSWTGRAQLIPIETINPDRSFVMEPWTYCTSFANRLSKWYSSSEFTAQAEVANRFYSTLPTELLGPSREKNLENAWNIYDYLNVEQIHNHTLSSQITPSILDQAAYWAAYHETGAFSDPDPSGVGNIAARGILSPILNGLSQITNSSSTPHQHQLTILAASYKPFLSLFQLFQINQLQHRLILYASTLIFEVRKDHSLSLYFRNGTQGSFQTFPININPTSSSSSSTISSVSDFQSHFGQYSISSLSEWCNLCQQTQLNGCSVLNSLNGTGSLGGFHYSNPTSTKGTQKVSPFVAGIIGSLVSIFLLLLSLAFLFRLGRLRFVKRNQFISLDNSNTIPKGPVILQRSLSSNTNSFELHRSSTRGSMRKESFGHLS